MAASLTASFVLKLEDRLSSGIVGLTKKLEALSALAAKLKFDGLQQAGGAFDKMGAAAETASRKVEGIGRSARSAVAELKRLSSQPIMINTGGTAFLPPSVTRAAMAATIAAAAAAGGAGGYRAPALPSASFFGPQLSLAGPGGGGIPLQPGQLFAAAGAWSRLRGELGQTAIQARRVGEELGHAGHKALAAAAAGFGIAHTIHKAAEVDSILRQAAIAQGLSGPAATQDVARMMRLVSEDATRTGQSVPGLAEAYGDLVARGLPPSLVDELIKTHSTAATAYHINPVDLGQTVYSLNKTLGIGHEDMGGAIAALAQSTHAGSFKMGDYARYLPSIAGQMKSLGWTGRGSLDSVAAMIEMVSHQSGTPEQTAIDFSTMMSTLTAKYSVKAFKHEGIDLPARMGEARKAGKNPVDAYLDILQGMIKGVEDPLQQAFILNKVLHNETASKSVRAVLQQRREQRDLTEQLHLVGGDKLLRDFQTAMAGLQPQLNRLSAEWQVFEMRLGVGFAHLVGPTIGALHAVNAALNYMDQLFPGLLAGLLTWGGGLAVVATALGVLIPLFRAMWAGLLLILAPFRLLWTALPLLRVGFLAFAGAVSTSIWPLIAIAEAALFIYEHWDKIGPYFQRAWAWVKQTFIEFYAWAEQWIDSLMPILVGNLKAAWEGLKGWFTELWKGIVSTFDTLISGVEAKIASIKNSLGLGAGPTAPFMPGANAPPAAPAGPGTPDNAMDTLFKNGAYHPGGARGSGSQFGFAPLEVKVTVDGPGRVDAPRQLEPVNRGPTLGRA